MNLIENNSMNDVGIYSGKNAQIKQTIKPKRWQV